MLLVLLREGLIFKGIGTALRAAAEGKGLAILQRLAARLDRGNAPEQTVAGLKRSAEAPAIAASLCGASR
ncbi:MAG TPA: hypothetical protein VFK05_13315 [Polyangiaceae bacterium]|nr:hypothetical protein [Polyangiaceae bacterium]